MLPFHKEYVRKDGSRVPVLVGGARVAGADRAIKFVIDLSERKRAEAERALAVRVLEAIVDGALGAVVRADLEGRIIDWNSHAEELFGRLRAEAIGKFLHETIIPPRFRAAHLAGLERFRTTGEGPILGQRIEVAALAAGDREFPVELLITPIRVDGGTTFCAFARDISERKRHEDDLRRAKDDAEQAQADAERAQTEAETAQADAERAADEARKANRTKSEFLANISHELRTPMNAILGMTDLALGEELSSLTRDYLGTAHDAATGLLYLLNDLLDFSRMEAGRFELEPVRVPASATRARRGDEDPRRPGRREAAGARPARPPGRAGRSSIGDPRRLQQVVMNVAGNAVKFTEAGEVVVDGGSWCARDQGPGTRGARRHGGRERLRRLPLGPVPSSTLPSSSMPLAPGPWPQDPSRSASPSPTPASASPPQDTRPHLRPLHAGRRLDDPPLRRHRAWAWRSPASSTELMGGRIWVENGPGRGSVFRWTGRASALPDETDETGERADARRPAGSCGRSSWTTTRPTAGS